MTILNQHLRTKKLVRDLILYIKSDHKENSIFIRLDSKRKLFSHQQNKLFKYLHKKFAESNSHNSPDVPPSTEHFAKTSDMKTHGSLTAAVALSRDSLFTRTVNRNHHRCSNTNVNRCRS